MQTLKEFINFGSNIRLGRHSDMTIDEFTILEEQKCRDTPYAVCHRSFIALIHIAMTALPSYSTASSSTIGAIALHGPHHVAQKSTITGWSVFRVSAKFASVITFAIFLFVFLFSKHQCHRNCVSPKMRIIEVFQ